MLPIYIVFLLSALSARAASTEWHASEESRLTAPLSDVPSLDNKHTPPTIIKIKQRPMHPSTGKHHPSITTPEKSDVLPSNIPKLSNYHPIYFGDLASWSELFGSIVGHARLKTVSLDDSLPKRLRDYIRTFFPMASFEWPGFGRDTIVREIIKPVDQLVYPGDLIVRGTVNRTQRIPSNIIANDVGVVIKIDVSVNELLGQGESAVGIMYFHHNMPDVPPPTSTTPPPTGPPVGTPTRSGEFRYDPERAALTHDVTNPPENYHPGSLECTQYSIYYNSMFVLLNPILGHLSGKISIAQLEDFFPGHVLTTIDCTRFTTTVLAINVPRFKAFREGDTLAVIEANGQPYILEAKYDGVLVNWQVGEGYRMSGGERLGHLLYFHPHKPPCLSNVDRAWYYNSIIQAIEVPFVRDAPPPKAIDFSDKIFDPEKPKVAKSSNHNKKDKRNKKKKAVARKTLQEKVTKAPFVKSRPMPSTKAPNDKNGRELACPLSTIIYKGSNRQVVSIGSYVPNLSNFGEAAKSQSSVIEKTPKPVKPAAPKTPMQPPKSEPHPPTRKTAERGLPTRTKPISEATPKKPVAMTDPFEKNPGPRKTRSWMPKPKVVNSVPHSVSDEPTSHRLPTLSDFIKSPRPLKTGKIPTTKAPSHTSSTDSQSPRSDVPSPSTLSTNSSPPPISLCRSDSLGDSVSSISSLSPTSSDGRPSPPLLTPRPVHRTSSAPHCSRLSPDFSATPRIPQVPEAHSHTIPAQRQQSATPKSKFIYKKVEKEAPELVPFARIRSRASFRLQCLRHLGLDATPSECVGFSFRPPRRRPLRSNRPAPPKVHDSSSQASILADLTASHPLWQYKLLPSLLPLITPGIESALQPISLSYNTRNAPTAPPGYFHDDHYIDPKRNAHNLAPPESTLPLPYDILMHDLDREFSQSLLQPSALEILLSLQAELLCKLLPNELVSALFLDRHFPELSAVPVQGMVNLSLYPLYSVHTNLLSTPHLPCIVYYLPTRDTHSPVPAFHYLVNKTSGEVFM